MSFSSTIRTELGELPIKPLCRRSRNGSRIPDDSGTIFQPHRGPDTPASERHQRLRHLD